MPSQLPTRSSSGIGRYIVVAILAVVSVPAAASLYIDLRWFQSLGHASIFETVLWTELAIGLATGLAAAACVYDNARLAAKLSGRSVPLYLHDADGIPRLNLGTLALRLALPASLLFGLLVGLAHAGQWQTYLLFRHAESFGARDPLFGRDVGYYVFELPLWNAAASLALLIAGACAVGTALVYTARGALQVVEGETRFFGRARVHLSALAALVLLVLAGHAYLAAFDLMQSTMGPVSGASYADVHAKLPALRIKTAMAVVAALMVLLSARREGLGLPLGAVALYFVSHVAVQAYPALVHRFSVQPNELERETPFLAHNIAATRAAYGLDAVSERELTAEAALTAADIAENAATVDNIRVWDHHPLLDTFAQIQEIRTYYDFVSVDNDRYVIDGKLRQTMLSPRELTAPPNPTWITRHLTFTHGYGLTLGPVNEATPQGLPELLVKDIPPVSEIPDDIRVTRPAIYFGERTNQHVFVRTRGREFDFPSTQGNVYTDYDGKDGIPFDSALVRFALSLELGSLELLLSDDIDAGSRALLHRNVRERFARIAPFLAIDADPYMVVRADGTLAWICDAYTISDRYPYAQRSRAGINYIRNSVKAVIDAYDGTVTLYVADETDPIVRAWRKAFPASFASLAEMPPDLRAHLRYPLLAFEVQTEMFAIYHMAAPELVYNREDQWEVPAISGDDPKRPMQPYYTVMKLPGEANAEFILMLPFTPKRKDNLAAWMVARSDGESLGQLVVYRFPKDRLVFGPQQVVNRINQDAEIARQISLWDQRGSKAEFGTLLVVPIEESLIYVRPLYLRSEGGRIPELKRVIVAYEDRIAMEPSLRQAMNVIFGEERAPAGPEQEPGPADAAEQTARAPAAAPAADAPPLTTEAHEQAAPAARALQHFERAIAAQRAGDWATYGAELREVERLLRDLQPPPAAPSAP